MHIFPNGSLKTFHDTATTEDDISVKAYEELENTARSNSYAASLHADTQLGKVCRLCVKLYESTK